MGHERNSIDAPVDYKKTAMAYNFMYLPDTEFGFDPKEDRPYPGVYTPYCSSFVAVDFFTIVGFLSFTKKTNRTLHVHSVYVFRNHRKTGIGRRLLHEVISKENPTTIKVIVVTNKGKTLVEQVKISHSQINWVISEGSARSLRNLKNEGKFA